MLLLSLTTRTLFSLVCPTAARDVGDQNNKCMQMECIDVVSSCGVGDQNNKCMQTDCIDMVSSCRTPRQSSGSGVRLDATLRRDDVGSPFGRFNVDTSSMAISIFEPDSGLLLVALILDFTTV